MAAIKLNVAQLSQILSAPNPTLINKAEVDEEVVLNSNNTSCSFAILENITFNSNVRFEAPSITTGIEFRRCVFKGNLSFENYHASNYPAGRTDFHSICLEHCELEGQLVILGCHVERGIQLNDCKLKRRFYVDNFVASNGSFKIKSSKISEIDLHSLKLTNLRFEQSEISDWVRFSQVSSQGGFVFRQTTFKKSFYLWAGKVNGITSNDSVYCEMVRFQAVNNSGVLALNGDNFQKSIQIDNLDQTNGILGLYKQIHISSSTFGSAFIFNGDNSEVELLTIVCSIALQGTITIGNCKVKSTNIKNDNHKGSIFFNSVLFEKLNFSQFNNFANLVFDSCAGIPAKNCEFSIERSNLGKAQFQNFDFTEFSSVKIFHSLLSNIEFSGVTWFRKEVLDVGPAPNQRSRIRDLYRQLKQASERQGDKIQSLEFQEQEMEAHDSLLEEKNMRWTSSGLSLWLARTNDYGRHWIKPTWLLLVSMVIFWILLTLSASDKVQFAPACSREDIAATWNVLKEQFSVMPQLLNPTRNINNIFANGNLNFWVYFWDALQRIVLAFLIVQIVSAFRKYYRS